MALLHIAFNLEDSRYVRPGTALDVLRQQAIPLGPTERAQLLMTPAFWKRRNWMWQRVDLRMRLRLGRITNTASWPSCRQMGSSGELDGGLNGPLFRGVLGEDEDILSEQGLALTVRDFLVSADQIECNEMSIVAVTGSEASAQG
ncbi:predicted protein [Aspergillus terreus NIH2624]|uniref:UCH catalytic domain-containing protein n=1 Tax=Aspergillus terreus (strain NIH 2624 / FGSC A1156) TaxID=341663 RepID=Q0CV44_ASPTN|nr:uncharacterized protein ATEG_02440 [Aspergillus terreus NIH2624]EAU37402.1 predicted protein [Aspergillus terreus NIH2624]